MKLIPFKKIGLTLAVIFLPASIKAQNNEKQEIVLTLNRAVEIALSESPTVKIAEKEIRKVDYAKKGAWYGLIPSLEATGQAGKYVKSASMSMMGQIMDSPTDFTAQAGLQLSLPLFAPSLWKTIQMTELDMQMAVEKAHASKITLRSDVTKTYYDILLAQDSYRTLQDGYSNAEEVYRTAKKRFDLGLNAEYDVISAEVQMKNLQPNLLEVKNGIERSKLYLKLLMGIDASTQIALEGNLNEYENEIALTNSADNLSTYGNTDLKQLHIQKLQLQKTLSLQKTQSMPKLAFYGNYTYAGTGNRATSINFGQMPIQVNASNEWYSQGLIVGLQLNVPITGIFTNTAKEKQIAIQIQQMDIQRDNLISSIELQIRTAVDNMNKSAKQVESAKKNEQLAQKGYAISSKRYEEGIGTVLELQNASLALTQSQLSYNQAIASYLSAKTDLDKVLGSEIQITK
ncbi:MAG: TolC family protein [Dysgonamonadaceae bacterium]|jgi:outer membrane protein TolC|nr:TolC family protein [Dysgonamonadaceae bacterium]